MKNKDDILLVDANNLMHRAYHAYRRLSHNGESTSILYGMPSLVSDMLFKFKPGNIILVWDGAKSGVRLNLVPNYKKRDKGKLMDWDNFNMQKKEVQKLFYYLGIKQALNNDAEADDLIYKLTQSSLKRGYKRVIIVSSDKDFNQLISDKVYTFNPQKDDLITPENCEYYFGYGPEQCVDYLCLVGDKSDNIPGYKGIGEVKGLEFIKRYKSIDQVLKGKSTTALTIDVDKLSKVYKVNRMMIDLEYFNRANGSFIKTKFIQSPFPTFNTKKVVDICIKWGLNKFRVPSFQAPFKRLQA